MHDFNQFEMYHAVKQFYDIATKNVSERSATTFGDLPDRVIGLGFIFEKQKVKQEQKKCIEGVPFTKNGLAPIPTWISNHVYRKVLDEFTYPLPNFSGCTVPVIWLGFFSRDKK